MCPTVPGPPLRYIGKKKRFFVTREEFKPTQKFLWCGILHTVFRYETYKGKCNGMTVQNFHVLTKVAALEYI